MGYYSDIGAAIGGKSEQIKKFVEYISTQTIPDNFEILKEFRLLDLGEDFSIFVFYHEYFKWYLEAEETWNTLIKLAEQFQLSYVLYRVGENPKDCEHDNNDGETYFDDRMENLFGFNCCLAVDDYIRKK